MGIPAQSFRMVVVDKDKSTDRGMDMEVGRCEVDGIEDSAGVVPAVWLVEHSKGCEESHGKEEERLLEEQEPTNMIGFDGDELES